jgi:hypothetical protein
LLGGKHPPDKLKGQMLTKWEGHAEHINGFPSPRLQQGHMRGIEVQRQYRRQPMQKQLFRFMTMNNCTGVTICGLRLLLTGEREKPAESKSC